MFVFTSLSGAQDSASFASQSLLELDGEIKILIDVGWDESFDVEKLREIEKQTQTISLILLTHPTIKNLGGFAHACKHFPLFTRIPVYATTPVISLGRTLLQDLYTTAPLASTIIPPSSLSEASYSYSQSQSNSEESHILRQPPSLDEIASYFALIHPLKYSQPYQPLASPFSPPLGGLTITAFNAGHTLGGTIWHIQHGLESVVYAVDWNQGRENVLSGAAWLGGAGGGGAEVIEQLRKPTALICSSKGSERVALSGGRTRRDELLLDMIRSAVAKGGIVLIPTDSSARVLELAYILEHAWRKESSDNDSPIGTTRLFLASKNINATLRYAKSMLEWMDESIVREFETDASAQSNQQHGQNTQGRGPFDFRHMRLLEKKSQVERVLNSGEQSIGKVILASDSSLEWGFSKEILRSIAADSRNMIIMTERLGTLQDNSESTGLARTLWSWYEERQDGVAPEAGPNGESLEQVYGGGRELEIKDAKRVPLADNELLIYQQWLATQRQLQTTLQGGFASTVDPAVDVIDDASSVSSSESEGSETEQQGKALNALTSLGQANRKKIGLSDEDLGINILLRRKGVHDFDIRGKKGREKMFPLAVRRKRTDDFGDMIRPEEYLRDEERDELDAEDVQPIGKYEAQETLGTKRKWDNVATKSDQRMMNGANKRQQNQGDGRREDGDGGHDSGMNGEESKEDAEEVVTGPSKVVYSTESITVNLRLAFVDFAGLHDKRALQMLIPLINPRKLILISGTEDEITTLANDCRTLLAAKAGAIEGGKEVDVFTPAVGTKVDASVDTNAWVVKLTDNLVRRLRWQNVKGLGIVTLTGHLLSNSRQQIEFPESEGGSNKKQKTQKETVTAVTRIQSMDDASGSVPIPSLDVVPTSMASATRSVAQPLHVGDLRLADLRKILQSSGHTAEFRGEGTLLIDSSVAVRKTGTGKIEIENTGFQQDAFYAVKRKIYEGLAVVAGG